MALGSLNLVITAALTAACLSDPGHSILKDFPQRLEEVFLGFGRPSILVF